MFLGFPSDSRFWTFSRPDIFAGHLNNLGSEAEGRFRQVRELRRDEYDRQRYRRHNNNDDAG